MKPFAGPTTGFRLSRAPLRAAARARRTIPTLGWGGSAVLFLSLALRCVAADSVPQEGTSAAALREYLARQDKVRSNEIYQLQLASDRQRRNAFEAALTEHLQAIVQPPQAPRPVQEDNRLVWAIIAALSLVLGLRVVAPPLIGYFVRRFDPWKVSALGKALDLSPQQLAEDPAWTGFVRAMEEGIKAATKDAAADSGNKASCSEAATSAEPPGDPSSFFELAPQRLASLRALFAEFSRPTEAPHRSQQVLELLREVQAFKESASAPELLPVRQLTAALVGLLTQLSKQPANLTPSTLRTLAAALDLLKDLCVRGVKPDLASEPPVRLLAVDDEPLTRGLVSRALQKVFSVPDMAPGGADALALAAKHSYDLIFLDVEMPGMDGFELCQALHQLPLNASTPVIFVTRHSDFQARAKSTLHGAQDLIAKPFLAFELALKALTLILRTRLNGGSPALQAVPAPVTAALQALETAPEPPPAPATPVAAAEPSPSPAVPNVPRGQPETPVVPANQKGESFPTLAPLSTPRLSAAPSPAAAESTPEATEAAQALLAQASAQFQSFRGQLDLLRGSARPEEINALLAKFYPSVASFCTEAYCARLNAAFRLGSALEAMLKKLLEKPKLRPPSTLESLALALDVLVEVAQSGQDPDLDQAPARLLVVDDDLLARRMMGEALQLAFGRPESVDCGEAALALAKQKAFDLIYLDVLMPGMDGFAACTEIRKTALNQRTPVMFVTSQSDLESRVRATASGGSGFLAKPTLPCEITLVTVSLLLRNRLAEESQAEPTPRQAFTLNADTPLPRLPARGQ